MRVVRKKGLARRGVRAADDPVVAPEALANLALRLFQVALDRGPKRGSNIREAFRRLSAVRLANRGFQNYVGRHIVVIVFVVGSDTRRLRAVIGQVGVADDKM